MRLESVESDSTGAFFDTKIRSIASWEHIEPENTVYIAMAYFDYQHL